MTDQISLVLQGFLTNIKTNLMLAESFAKTHPSPMYTLSLLLVMILLLRILRVKAMKQARVPSKKSSPSQPFMRDQDVGLIAGDNLVATQLDLARAYIEMDKKNLAKNILFHVKKQGTQEQRTEAQQLIDTL